jgi:hypothetical protein
VQHTLAKGSLTLTLDRTAAGGDMMSRVIAQAHNVHQVSTVTIGAHGKIRGSGPIRVTTATGAALSLSDAKANDAVRIAGTISGSRFFCPAGQRLMLCIVAREYLGVAMSRMTFVSILAALSIGAVDRAQTPAPAATTHGIDCWMPRWDIGMNNPRWAPMRPALDTVERVVKANQAFMSQMPERVRMEIETNGADGTLGVTVSAYPRQIGEAPYWSATGCNIVTPFRGTRQYERPLGQITVNFNRRGVWRADFFNQSGLKPVRIVAGFPVFEYRHSALAVRYELLMIAKDGRLPIVPVTLADRLDQESAYLATRLGEVRQSLASSPPATVETIQRGELTELLRQVEALRTYRASFTPEQLRSAWIRNDDSRQSPEWPQTQTQIKALETPSLQDQAELNAIGARVRALQLQARTRGTTPDDAAKLRAEANTLLNRAAAINLAQKQKVQAQVIALRNDVALKMIRPGDASQANQFKDDPTFYDASNPTRIQLISVDFSSGESRATTAEQAKAWMDSVEASFDVQALKALIR